METTTINIGGMTCGGCEKSLTRILSALPSVQDVVVSKETGSAKLNFDATQTNLSQLKAAIEGAGYEVL